MKRLFLVLSIALFAFLSGCGGSGSPTITTQAKGSLILNVSQNILNTKIIEPDLDMTIATYDVSGTGPNGTNFQKNNVAIGTPVTINALAVGAWTIIVNAKNADETVIASGVAPNVFIAEGVSNYAEIEVRPLTGVGELHVGLSWPSGIITNPSVTGILTRIEGGSSSNITFTLAGDGLSATYQNNALEAGYYNLSVQLKDGSVRKWGGADIVRIIAGQTSTGGFPLTSNPGQIGDIELVIDPDLQNPIAISFSGQQENLPVGTNMTVTATTNADPVDSYQWYLNGILLTGETGPSITIGGSLGAGSYRLDLVVVKGNIAGSKTHTFEVGGNGGISFNHEPIEPGYMPRIPEALSENSPTNNWEMAPQMVTNYNSWMDYTIIPDVNALKSITGSCSFRGWDLTYETGANLDDDPHYTVKMTMQSGGALRALFFCNNDKSRWRHIIFSEGTSNGEVRETRYVNDGIVAHIVLLFYRMNVDQMNSIMEIWHYSDEERIKSIGVYKSPEPDIIVNFGADVNLATGKHHTTAVNNKSFQGSKMILGYFNDDDLFVDENITNPAPALYPSPEQAENVYNTHGITPEIVGNVTIDANLNSNFYQLYPF